MDLGRQAAEQLACFPPGDTDTHARTHSACSMFGVCAGMCTLTAHDIVFIATAETHGQLTELTVITGHGQLNLCVQTITES